MNKIGLTNKSLSSPWQKNSFVVSGFSQVFTVCLEVSHILFQPFSSSLTSSLSSVTSTCTLTRNLFLLAVYSLSRSLLLSLHFTRTYTPKHKIIQAHTHSLSFSLTLSLSLSLSYSLFIAFQLSFISTYTHLSNTQGQKVFGLRQVEC